MNTRIVIDTKVIVVMERLTEDEFKVRQPLTNCVDLVKLAVGDTLTVEMPIYNTEVK